VVPGHLKGRDLLRVADWAPDELLSLIDLADALKVQQAKAMPHRYLEGRTLAMIFDKPSTRTRVSFAAGMAHLGGTALAYARDELQLGRGEAVRDAANVLSRYVDAIVIRTFGQDLVEELAEHASIPVINGLTDEDHPCQALADVMTIRERFGTLAGLRVAYVGDGNNTCQSLMVACAKLGASFVAATPAGYEPRREVVDVAAAAAAAAGNSIELVVDPSAAAAGSDVLYTDVWTSMGQEGEHEQRLRDFEGYGLDEHLVGLASPRGVVMHCLPAHHGEEIETDVLYGPRSAVWDQAENRLHAQKALLALVVA
jgi:ornithine carbamoyltransferase